jgi:RNA polymerase sigma-70 factor (ECF subfamily)
LTAGPDTSQALESLFARFGGVLRTIAARYRLAPGDRDDLLQEVRIRLWRAIEGERIDALPASYLYRAATSAALDLLRRRRNIREDAMEDVGAVAHTIADPVPHPDRQAEHAELARCIERAIEEIPASRRTVVRMYLGGYGSGEIAEIMGWTEAKARNLVYRGLADLRARLAEAGITPDTR